MQRPTFESSNHNKKTINPAPQAPSIVPPKHPRRRQTPRHLELLSPDCRLVVSLLQFNHPPSLKTPRSVPQKHHASPQPQARPQQDSAFESLSRPSTPSSPQTRHGQKANRMGMPKSKCQKTLGKMPRRKMRKTLPPKNARPSRGQTRRAGHLGSALFFRTLTWRGDAHRPPSSPSRKSLHE